MQNIKIILTFRILFFVTNITVASSDNSSIPHTFTSGSTISSSEINNNFTHVTPYLVKSNGTPIGVYFISTLEDAFIIDENLSLNNAINILWNFRDTNLSDIKKLSIPVEPYEFDDGRQVLIISENFTKYAESKGLKNS